MLVLQNKKEETPQGPAPSFWSTAFHFSYFPKSLWKNLKNHPDSRQGHIFFEIPIALAICGFLIAWGLPNALQNHSPIGWLAGLLGTIGIISLVVYCLLSTSGTPLSYLEFEPWIFLFFTFFGFFGGFLAPGVFFKLPLWVGLISAPAGIGIGYLIGIPAGLYAQRLGPLRAFLALGAGLGFFIVFVSGLIGAYLTYLSPQ
jgi:hypothetical protein